MGWQGGVQAVFTRVLTSTLELWSSESNKNTMLQDVRSWVSQHGVSKPCMFSVWQLKKGGQNLRLPPHSGNTSPSARRPETQAARASGSRKLRHWGPAQTRWPSVFATRSIKSSGYSCSFGRMLAKTRFPWMSKLLRQRRDTSSPTS